MTRAFSIIEKDVIDWGRDKGILDSSNPKIQLSKTLSELSELLAALEDNNEDEIIDGYGDVLVTLILGWAIHSKQETSLCDCLEISYNVIKNRTGRMEGGLFIKDA